MALPPLHINSFTRTFLAFFFAFTVPVSALALYMGHVGEIAGYKVDKPGNQLPMAAVLRSVPDISVYGQSQGVAGTTRVHVTGKKSMGFHTLYVLPDNRTVIAGVPLGDLKRDEVDLEKLAEQLEHYYTTLQFLSAQYTDSDSGGSNLLSPLEQSLKGGASQN